MTMGRAPGSRERAPEQGAGAPRREPADATQALRTAIAAALLGAACGAAAAQEWLDDPAQLYARACAPCHGADGSGIGPEHPNYSNFEVLPADLSDPLFSSLEPRADWHQVVKHGGGRMGLSNQMPAFGEALTDEQIARIVDFLKSLADAGGYPPGDLNFTRPIDTIKAFPEDEVIVESRYESVPGGPDGVQNVFEIAQRFGRRSHGEIKLVHVDEGGDSKLEAVELEYKGAITWSLENEFLLTGGLEAELPTEGDESIQVNPFLSFAKGLSDTLTLQGNLLTHLPVDDTSLGDVKLSAVVHWLPTPFPRGVFPGLEWTVTQPFSSGRELEASVLPQLYFGLSRRGHVALSVAVELPLTGLDYDYRIRSFLLWDMADGPLWEGW